MVLGQLIGVSAADIDKGAHGKPCSAGSRAIGFSVSHSGGFSLPAFARDAEIGYDIQKNIPSKTRGRNPSADGGIDSRGGPCPNGGCRERNPALPWPAGFVVELHNFRGRRQVSPANCDNSGPLFCAERAGAARKSPR